MKHLRQYIRQILLTEGMNTPDMLPDHVMVVIKPLPSANFLVYYGYKDNPNQIVTKGSGAFMGRVSMGGVARNSIGNCGGAMKVDSAEALSGWGPMLYDVAMEHATQIANGLFADRDEVSDEAKNVWDYYMRNRGDVMTHQLDDPRNSLTPTEEDNCDQEVAGGFHYQYSRAEEPENPDWMKSSLSKRYTKEPTTINALKAAGKLAIL